MRITRAPASQRAGAGLAAAAFGLALLAGCTPKAEIVHKVQMDPIRVEPIQINATIRVEVERELEDVFDYKDRYHQGQPAPVEGAAATQPGGV